MTRVVCVSNRVAVPKRGAAPGGLTVGVLSALRKTGGVWFGWGGELTDEEPGEPETLIRDNIKYVTIRLRRREFEAYYNGHANSTLWPLFHYLMRSFRYNERQQQAYRSVNRAFAERLVTVLEPDDVIWVHDYHLIPLAEQLREFGVTRPMGFFLHIPFPHIEMLRVLPTYAELLREMVAYDVVGFQTENDLNSFLAAVEYVWGRDAIGAQGRIHIGTRSIRTGVFPIGIDVPAVEAAASAAAQSDAVRRLSASLLGRKLMVGVDRLDYSKGLIERFAAYQSFLESYPENLGKITFMQVAPLSRTDVRAYAEIRSDARAVSRAHQRPLRGCRLDTDPLSQPQRASCRTNGVSASRAGRAGHARARRHESRRQGIRRGAGSGRPRCADPFAAGRCSARVDRRYSGQSLRCAGPRARHADSAGHAAGGATRSACRDDGSSAPQRRHGLV